VAGSVPGPNSRFCWNPLTRARLIGFVVLPLDAGTRGYFGVDSGLVVTEVRRDSPANRAGWAPGDIVATIDGVSASSGRIVEMLDASAADTHAVVLRRGKVTRTTRLSAATAAARVESGTGIELARPAAAPGVVIGVVRRGSAAAAAGVRASDRLLRVGNVAVTSAATAQRLLDGLRPTDRPSFVVFERDSIVHGVLLRQ
jgi:S1-C subfamily serine protease